MPYYYIYPYSILHRQIVKKWIYFGINLTFWLEMTRRPR